MRNPTDLATWERLARLLENDALLRSRERDAATDEKSDPWEALLDGLDDAGALAYLDVDDTGMELADALAQLPRVFRLQPDLGAVNDIDELPDALIAADALLAGSGCRLVRLHDPDEDAHALVVVPADHVGEIVRLSSAVGRPVVTFG